MIATPAAELLDRLGRQGVHLVRRGDRILFRPVDGLKGEGLAEARSLRGELLLLLPDEGAHRRPAGMLHADFEGLSRSEREAYIAYEKQTADMAFEQATEAMRAREDPRISGGSAQEVPKGWSRPAFVRELRRMADCCEALRPDLAAEYRQQANAIALDHPDVAVGRAPTRYPRPGGGTETFVERAERYRRECGGLPPGASPAKSPS
jgi:hypothetical protein